MFLRCRLCKDLLWLQTTAVAQHQVQYVANQPRQVIAITKPVVTNQPGLQSFVLLLLHISAHLLPNMADKIHFLSDDNHLNKKKKITLIFFILVVTVPVQPGFTASLLTLSGEPPWYTTVPDAKMAAPQGQPMYECPAIQQPRNAQKGMIG